MHEGSALRRNQQLTGYTIMRMRNETQLKAYINKMVKEASIPAQALMQSYLLERLFEYLSR